MKKNCVVTNLGSHYRLPIYALMASRFGCHYYLGDRLRSPVKTFDYRSLTGFRHTLHNVFVGPFYWQCGAVRLLFKPYDVYILDGEPYCLSAWVMLLLAKALGKETIAWTHGWYGREGWLKRIIKKVFYQLHDKLMVYSQYAIALMEREGIAKNKLFCIANSLDSDRQKAIRDTLSDMDTYAQHFRNVNPCVIYCGRIQHSKKLDLLLQALKRLKDEGHLVNVIFVGKDVDGVGLTALAEDLGLEEQVWMYGPCYDDAVLGQLFHDAYVCVSPGNVGLTAVHALTFGCPIITHDNFPYQAPEFEAIVPGLTGDFFRQGDVNDLAAKILNWTSKNKEQRRQVRQAAYGEIDRKWNVHYQLEVIEKVIYGQ